MTIFLFIIIMFSLLSSLFIIFIYLRDVAERCRQLKPGEVVLLENLRFHAEEMGENVSFDAVLGFRAFLSSLAGIFFCIFVYFSYFFL